MANPNTSRFKVLSARMIRDLMRDFSPLADFQAAGIVGNGGGESGGFTIAQEGGVKKGRGGWGGFQWTGPRRVEYENYLRQQGKNPADPNAALDYDMMYGFLKKELQSTEKTTIPALRRTTSLAEATKVFMEKFERPGIAHYQGRLEWSKMALDAYHAEQAKIVQNPIEVVKKQKEGVAPAEVIGVVKEDAPVDGKPKPKENNTSFWSSVGIAVTAIFTGTYRFFIDWLPLIVLVVGIIFLFIYALRPAFVRWRDYLQHAPELADVDIKTRIWIFFDGFWTKIAARLTQALGGLIVALNTATSLAGTGGIDLNDFLPHLPLLGGATLTPTQYIAGGLVALGWFQDWLRERSDRPSGTINPIVAVELAAQSQHVEGAKPSEALAAVAGPQLVDLVATAGLASELPPPRPRRKVTKRGKAATPRKAKRRTRAVPAKQDVPDQSEQS